MIHIGDTPSQESTPLKFQPLHAGVGFHPFSDGLPYAPAIPARSINRGTGATAAGPTRPVLAKPPSIIVQATPPLPRPEAFSKKQTLQQSSSISAPQIEKNFGWTYPMARSLACGVDLIFNGLITSTVLGVASLTAGIEPWFLLEPSILGLTVFFLLAFCWSLTAAQEILFKTTLGKRLFGLKLRGSSKAILIRSLLFVPSAALGAAGLLWSFFDRDRRCWHDVATGLQPTRITQL